MQKTPFEIGTKYAIHAYDYRLSSIQDSSATMFSMANFNEKISTLNNYISWKYRLNEKITIVAGLHNMNVLYNNKTTIEPRLAMNWQLNSSSSLNAGYGKHSTMESVHNYFAMVKQLDGSITDLIKIWIY